jgi:hypothetical protein
VEEGGDVTSAISRRRETLLSQEAFCSLSCLLVYWGCLVARLSHIVGEIQNRSYVVVCVSKCEICMHVCILKPQ